MHKHVKQHVHKKNDASLDDDFLHLCPAFMCSCMCCSDASHPSMSSGLSPRDMRPRVKPWDLEEGFRVRRRDLLLKHLAISLSFRAAAIARVQASPCCLAFLHCPLFVPEGIAEDKHPRAHPSGAVQCRVSPRHVSGLPLLPDGF